MGKDSTEKERKENATNQTKVEARRDAEAKPQAGDITQEPYSDIDSYLTTMFREHHRQFVARAFSRGARDPEDTVQDAYVRILSAFRNRTEEARSAGLVHKTTKWQVLDQGRKAKNEREKLGQRCDVAVLESVPGPESPLRTSMDHELWQHLCRNLSAIEFAILKLSFRLGMTSKEAGDVLKMQDFQIRKAHMNMRPKLAELLADWAV